MKSNIRNIDVLCVGEVLIDFIGHQQEVLINNTRDYHRYLGGSPTNVAMNSARLGVGAQSVGIADAAYREALKYAEERAQFGKVIANGATNIVPNEVKIEGTLRAMDEKWRKNH